MATINGYLPPSRPGAIRPALTSSIDTWYVYPGESRLFNARPVVRGIISRGTPTDIPGTRNGYITFNLIDRLYNRIIISPLRLDLGNVATDTTIDLSVFNAFFVAKTLTSITINTTDGITIDGPAVPRVFNRLSIQHWIVTVLAAGDPEINYTLTFQFLGLPAIRVVITGRRAVSWTYGPTWSESVTETLSWLTDVMTSQTGAEQRRARRLSPRRTLEFTALLTTDERRRFEQLVYLYAARVWALPIFCDRQPLRVALPAGGTEIPLTTAGYDIAPDSHLMLQRATQSELVKVAAVFDDRVELTQPTAFDYPVDANIFPVRAAQLAEMPKLTRLTDETLKSSVKFIINEHNPYPRDYPFTVYRGHPVLDINSSWHEDLSNEYQRLVERIDNETGLIAIRDTAGRAFTVQEHHFVIFQRAENDAFRRLLYALRGRLKPVWLPSQNTDFIAVVDIDGTTIDVTDCGYEIAPGRRDICIELAGGARIYRRIETVTDIDNGRQRLGLDGAAFKLSLNMILKISLMTLARLNNDDIELAHVTDADGITTTTVQFRGVRDDLE
jgi:hypothetical protein